MSGEGDASLAFKRNNPTFDKTTYAVSSVTGNAITNLFDNADLNKYEGAEDPADHLPDSQRLGRNLPTGPVSLRITEQMWADGLSHDEADRAALVERYKEMYYPDATMPEMGVAGDLSANDFAETDADDPAWADLIKQVPYSEMTNVIYNGFHLTQPVPSIGLPGYAGRKWPPGLYQEPDGRLQRHGLHFRGRHGRHIQPGDHREHRQVHR